LLCRPEVGDDGLSDKEDGTEEGKEEATEMPEKEQPANDLPNGRSTFCSLEPFSEITALMKSFFFFVAVCFLLLISFRIFCFLAACKECFLLAAFVKMLSYSLHFIDSS